MDPADTVTAGLAGVCVDERGRLVEHPLLDCSARAALAADLAGSGRLHDGGDAVHVDTDPPGWAPLDATVEALAAGGRTLDDLVLHGHLGLRDVVEELVTVGAWTRADRRYRRRPRYDTGRPRDPWGRTPERRLVQPPGAAPATPRDAAVLLLALAAGLGHHERPVDDLIDRTGGMRWLCRSAWAAISAQRAADLRAARALRLGRSPGVPG